MRRFRSSILRPAVFHIPFNVLLGWRNIFLLIFPTFFRNNAGSTITSLITNFPLFLRPVFTAVLNPCFATVLKAFLIDCLVTTAAAFSPCFTPSFIPTLIAILAAVVAFTAAPQVNAVATSKAAPIAKDTALSSATLVHPALA